MSRTRHVTHTTHDQLRRLAAEVAARAYVPYSRQPTGMVVFLADGSWIPGVRVENASFPLVIPMLVNAWTTTVALGRDDIIAVTANRAFTEMERVFLASIWPNLHFKAEDTFRVNRPMPHLLDPLSPFISNSANSGIDQAHLAAQRALVPESNFPVGCVLETEGGWIPGCNVEHADWLYTLCAERNALGTAVSYGLHQFDRMYLTCLKAPGATPCGACRQVLVEHAPELPLIIDNGDEPPVETTPSALLPDYFGPDLLG
jgi:homotetrameric cytidine deaminase